jgi:methionyl-tRNA synthetase
MTQNVLVCTAWPYASGPIHLGHLAGHLIPPDIYTRFRRMRGDRAILISGSDEHGTPITIAAEGEGLTPQELVDRVHGDIERAIEEMGIKFSLYSRTTAPHHEATVHELFNAIKDNGHIREYEMEAMYCVHDERFLPDRYVEGTCPNCGYESARGDQCDECGHTHEPIELALPRCKICGNPPERRSTKHMFFALGNFEDELRVWIEGKEGWRPNVVKSTLNWLDQGLRDRAVTRDIGWGITVPVPGYEDKRIYVWFEAVMGYFSTTVEWARQGGDTDAWKDFWLDPTAETAYFLGKDNIPFHTIMWPAILMAASKHDARYNLPTNVPANEFLMLSGAQFSKSRRHALYVHEYLQHFEPAPLRYYLTTNMPELKDTDFTIEEFVARNNDELLGNLGNFVNRVLTFTYRNFDGQLPPRGDLAKEDEEFLSALEAARDLAEDRLLAFEFKASLRALMELARAGNVYFDRQKPWELVRTDKDRCGTVLSVCAQVLQGLAILMSPYLPFKAQELWELLGLEGKVDDQSWREVTLPTEEGRPIPKPYPLIRKLDADEVARTLGLPTIDELEAAEAEAEEEGPECPADILDMVVARITSVEAHPDADKLWVMQVDLGDMGERTLVAGLRTYYEREELEGADIVIVTNLAPAKLRGVLSEGMLLAAEGKDGTVSLLKPHGVAEPGERLWSPVDASEKGTVDFKSFLEIKLRAATLSGTDADAKADASKGPMAARVREGLEFPELAVVTPDGESLRVLHTPGTIITLDRPVKPGSEVH